MPQAPVRHQRRPTIAPTASRATSTAVDWDRAVALFLREKRGENLAPSTLENYRSHLLGDRTEVFRSEHKIHGPADLTAEALSGFQADLLEAGVSPALAHAYHRVIKNFARFCIDHGYLTEESVLRVKAPHLPSKEPE